jgi:hypothetical protein
MIRRLSLPGMRPSWILFAPRGGAGRSGCSSTALAGGPLGHFHVDLACTPAASWTFPPTWPHGRVLRWPHVHFSVACYLHVRRAALTETEENGDDGLLPVAVLTSGTWRGSYEDRCVSILLDDLWPHGQLHRHVHTDVFFGGLTDRLVLQWPQGQLRQHVHIGVSFGGLRGNSVLRAICMYCTRPAQGRRGDGEKTETGV